jgi:hypothetical protein
MTSLHWVQEKVQVPYKYYKRFTGLYTDESITEKRGYFMHVRALHEGAVTKADHVQEDMEKAGRAFTVFAAGIPISLVKINELYRFVSNRLEEDRHYLHRDDTHLARANSGAPVIGN